VREVEFWIEGLKGPEATMFSGTRDVLLCEMELNGEGMIMISTESSHWVPDSFHNFDKFSLTTLGWVGGAERVKPLPEDSEKRIVEALVRDLESLKVTVSRCIDCGRDVGVEQPRSIWSLVAVME